MLIRRSSRWFIGPVAPKAAVAAAVLMVVVPPVVMRQCARQRLRLPRLELPTFLLLVFLLPVMHPLPVGRSQRVGSVRWWVRFRLVCSVPR